MAEVVMVMEVGMAAENEKPLDGYWIAQEEHGTERQVIAA